MAKRLCQSKGKRKDRLLSSTPSDCSSNWASLPDDLLNSIIEKVLPNLSYYIRFSAVCKSWNSLVLNHKEKRILLNNHQLPFLFARARERRRKLKLWLYNFTTGTEINNFKLRIHYRYQNSPFCGSSHGWLFFFLKHKATLIVTNPLSGQIISLPPLNKEFIKNVGSAVVSRDPCLGPFEVLVTNEFSTEVAHLKFGEEVWTYLERKHVSGLHRYDITFYKGCIVGVRNSTRRDQTVSLCVQNSCIKVEEIELEGGELMRLWKYFFVETTNGDLLIVGRSYNVSENPRYKIYEIKDSNGRFHTSPVVDLCGHSLFLHKGTCILVLASNFPVCEPNTIYYMESKFQLTPGIQEVNFKYQRPVRRYQLGLSDLFDGCWIVPSMKL